MTTPNSIVALASASDVQQVRSESLDLKAARERELMQRICAGETDLFYELIRPYERGVFFAAASILGNDADAEEVAQEAVLKAFKNLARFRQESKFSTWLIQIAINEAKMKLRKDRRHLYESIDNGQQTDEGAGRRYREYDPLFAEPPRASIRILRCARFPASCVRAARRPLHKSKPGHRSAPKSLCRHVLQA